MGGSGGAGAPLAKFCLFVSFRFNLEVWWEPSDNWLIDAAAESISHIIGALLILALGLILFKHLIMAFSAPFMSPVSEKIEAYFNGNNNLNNHSKSLVPQQKISKQIHKFISKKLIFI